MLRTTFLAGVTVLTLALVPTLNAAHGQQPGRSNVVMPEQSQAAGQRSFTRLAQVRTSRDASALELAFWNTIKDSTNPADFQAYLEAFPEGTFVPLARIRAQSGGNAVEDSNLTYIARVASNIRAEPTAGSAQLGALAGGERVQVTGRSDDGNWLQIALNDGGTGFVFGELLAPADEPLAAPPAPAPAAPAPAAVAVPPAPPATQQPQVAAITPPTSAKSLGSLDPLATFRDCDDCPEMVVLPPGSYVMGDDRGDKTQRPARDITIGRGFAIGQFEVTVDQWRACMAAGSCSDLPALDEFGGNTPVRNVSWDDARQYTAWLSQATGRVYRLPSEAEWEYAARGGTRTTYAWGNDLSVGLVACRNCGGEWSRETPGPVGTYEANALGLFDMHGSIAEWTSDCWTSSLKNTPADGSAYDQQGCRQRVLRGGSWRSSNPVFLTSAARFFYDAPVRFVANGFRVVAAQ